MTSASSPTPIDLAWLSDKIPYRRYQECVHCGLCTASCPTYIETCDENDSPRGRIYLMRAIADGRLAMGSGVREHLELCLDCRACESACPSGVQYGKMIEPFKIALASSAQGKRKGELARALILHHLFPYSEPRAIGACTGALAAKTRLARLRRANRPHPASAADPEAHAGHAAEALWLGRRLPGVLPAIGPKRARVGTISRLRCRRHVSRDQCGNRPCPARKWLRSRDPPRPGLLRRDPLPLGSRRACARTGPKNMAVFD